MYEKGEDLFYYLTLYNEKYSMPPMPEGAQEGILKGLYKFKAAPEKGKHHAQIFGSGPLINEALRAQTILAQKYGVAADVWSANQLQVASQRRPRIPPLEHAASRRKTEKNPTWKPCLKTKKGRSLPCPTI